MSTVKLGPEDVAEFRLGETVTIEDFRYETACAIFGRPLVDAYYEWKRNPAKPPAGVCKVVGIDHGAGVITFSPVTTPSEGDDRATETGSKDG